MDYLKQFLEHLVEDERYYVEMIDNVAEIYISTESKPVVLLEFDDEVFHLNFRCDLTSSTVAQITYDITIIDEDIAVGADFFSTPESGLIYGQQAQALYFASMFQAFEDAQMNQEAELLGAMFVVKQPIETAYGIRHDRKNRMQRLLGTDLE